MDYSIPIYTGEIWDGMKNIIDFCTLKQTLSRKLEFNKDD